MKEQYEFRARTYLPRRSYSILRLDGKAFHTYTRGLERPFDQRFMHDMAATAHYLCGEIAGTVLAFVQSDEISLLLTDFATNTTEAWFDGNVQKMTSVSASLATARFNELRPGKLACFDSRAFTIPDPTEVANYFVWRQQDCTRNSVSMAAQSLFSPKQLHGKSGSEMQEMMWCEHGVNWNDYPVDCRRGTVIVSRTRVAPVTFTHKKTGEEITMPSVERRFWDVEPAPIFTQTDLLSSVIPRV